MSKLKFLVFAMLCVLGGYMVGGIVKADHIPLNNGDFETGDLAGWTVEATAGGTLGDGYPNVVSFDMDGADGPLQASNAVQFSVGTLSNNGGGAEGGTIYQNVHLTAGDYNVSAEVSVDERGTPFGVMPGGLFELIVDNVVLDSHDFGQVGPDQTIYKLLSNLHVVSDGDHQIGVRITRTKPPAPTLLHLVDNISAQVIVPTSSASPDPADAPPAEEGCDNRGHQSKADRDGSNKGGNSGYANCGQGKK